MENEEYILYCNNESEPEYLMDYLEKYPANEEGIKKEYFDDNFF